MNSFEWVNATSASQAVSLMVKGSVFKAGGVDVIDLMKEHLLSPTRVININRMEGMSAVADDPKSGLTIGPLCTLAQIGADPVIAKRYTAIAQAAQHAATPQIRNMATIGGNLLQRPRCWYFRNEAFHCRKKGGEICYAQEGENQYHAIFNNKLCAIVHPSSLAVALVALGASIELTGPKEVRTIKLEDFFVLPSADLHRENTIGAEEIITAIKVPAPAGGSSSAYVKQGEKESFDWPIAECAVSLAFDDGGVCTSAAVVLGAAAPTPYRPKDAEAALLGKSLSEEVAREAGKASVAGASPLAQNGYKLQVFPAVVARTILMASRGNA